MESEDSEEDVEKDAALQLLGLSDVAEPVVKPGMHFTSLYSFHFTSDIVVNKRGRPVVSPEAAKERTIQKAYLDLNRAIKDGMLFCTIFVPMLEY